MKRHRVSALVALLAMCAYATALAGTFVYDDVHSVAANPGVQTLSNLGRFFVDPTLFSGAGSIMYRPLLLCSFAVDWSLGQGSAVPFKLTNVWLHAGTAALLCALLRAHGVAAPTAGLAAAWFAVHPLASETVNMVSARSEGLFAFGLVLALWAHRRLLARRSAWATAWLWCGAMLAVGSKETGVVVGPLLLVQEWLAFGLRRRPDQIRDLLRRVLPVLLIAAGYLVVRKLLLGQATATLLGRAGNDPMFGHTRDLGTQLATMGALLPKVVVQMLLPTGLGIDPPVVYHRSLLQPTVLCGWTCLALLTWLGLRRGRATPVLWLGTAVAWAAALPWVVIPLNLPLAEHRCYGPLLGFSCVAAAALQRLQIESRCATAGCRAATALVLAGLGLAAAMQSLRYRDEALLWQQALAIDGNSFRAHWGLGTVALRRGDPAAAEPSLAQSCALYPAFRTARRAWVECLLQLSTGHPYGCRALVVAEELARQKDDDPYYCLLHANALLTAGIETQRTDWLLQAERTVLRCLELGPPKATVFRLAAEARRRLGDEAGALGHLDTAIERGLAPPALRAERSEVLRALGRTAEAERELRAALRQAPVDPVVRAAWQRRQDAAMPPR